MKSCYDLAVVGSGFAGSLMAMIAKRLGHSVVLLERGSHPRVVIGESSTPLSNLLLETIAERYNLPFLNPLTKWGSWQREYPEIACGLKRGFTFFHHDLGAGKAEGSSSEDRQLLMAASPNDSLADTHWFRADFDRFLMEQACALDVKYLEQCNLLEMKREDGLWALSGVQGGQPVSVRARFVIDATGPRGCLHRLLSLREAPLPNYPATSALFSHFTGVKPFAGNQAYARGGPPYPPDAAALHHVFEGGWMWVLRFNNGWTSAGFAASGAVAKRFAWQDGEAAWTRMLAALPEVNEQFCDARAEREFTYMPQISFRSETTTGEGWAMLPSAAGFVDPLLSTGFPLTLLGVLRLGEVLERGGASPTALRMNLAVYADITDRELLATADLIAALYANMGNFSVFRALSLLYFAAASYAETVRRLGKPHLAASFLLQEDKHFGPACRRITARARERMSAEERLCLEGEIYELLADFDVAGLTKRPLDHCYPVRAEDLFAGGAKVHATKKEIEVLLLRTGFSSAPS